MGNSLKGRVKFIIPVIHFFLSFLYERRIFIFEPDRDAILTIPRNYVISDTGERILGYVISKLFAAAMIFFVWYLVFWVVENWKKKTNVKFFVFCFLIGYIIHMFCWPNAFSASADNLITYSGAIRFWPEYWHSAYTSCVYAGILMVVPSPLFIAGFQWLFGVFVLGYLYNRILESPVLKGKGKYFVFSVFLMPGVEKLFTDPYRTEIYALLCMFVVSMTVMDVVDHKKRGIASLVFNIVICGFIGVWRTEGVILGLLLFVVQLFFVYQYDLKKSVFLFVCVCLSFGLFSVPQKLGDIKYYGKDYSFINSFPTLKNIFSAPSANLSYDGAEEDMAAMEAVTPVELIRYYGMDGYRRYNYANGRPDINQSLASDETAAAYMKAYYRILAHNLPIYIKTQASMVLEAVKILDNSYVVPCDQPPVHDLEPWVLRSWEMGTDDLKLKEFEQNWMYTQFRYDVYAAVIKGNRVVKILLDRCYVYNILLILIPLFEVYMFFAEGVRFLKKKENYVGFAGLSVILLGQAAAISLVMPAGMLAYFHTYYYCSLILCLIYVNCVRCRRENRQENV